MFILLLLLLLLFYWLQVLAPKGNHQANIYKKNLKMLVLVNFMGSHSHSFVVFIIITSF
jgi:hypothetical protein